MSDVPKAIERKAKYEGETLTQEQFDEIFQTGSISLLTQSQRSSYLYWYAQKLNLNPFSKPFDLIPGQNGQLIVYANRSCSDQLRQNQQLTDRIKYAGPLLIGAAPPQGEPIKDSDIRRDVYQVVVELEDPNHRKGEGMGLVGITGLEGEALANAIMKCHTKALRRATLAFCGLSFPDETELGSWSQAPVIEATVVEAPVDPTTIPQAKPPRPRILDGAKAIPSATPPAKV